MTRPRLPRFPRPPRPSTKTVEDWLLTAGFFAGLTMVAAAVWMVYMPAGLLVGGVLLATVCGLLARSGG